MAGLSRRAVLRAGAVALAGGVATACGLPRGRSGAAPPGRLHLTLLGQGGGGVGQVGRDLMPLASALAAGYSGATGAAAQVQATAAPDGLSAFMTGTLAGHPPLTADLMLTTPAVRDLFGAANVMTDLDAALGRSGLAAGLYPATLSYCAPGGRQRMIPVFRDPLVVFYNADALARAGVNPPAAGWTADDLLSLCGRLLTQSRGTGLPLANAVGRFDLELLTAFVLGYGGQMLGPSNLPGVSGYVPQFAAPAALLGINALLRLHAFEPAQPAATPQALFAAGTAAFYFGHHAEVADLEAGIGDLFAWGVAPLPGFPVRAAQPVRALGVAALTSDPGRRDAAIAAALFAATPAGQMAAARTGLGVPALRALAASPVWRQSAPQLNNDVFVGQPEADVVLPPALWYIAPQLQAALRAVLAGAPVAQTFTEASTAVEYTLQAWPNF